jgi:methylated-DNA-[protein]-cysteine S-methyltransferase
MIKIPKTAYLNTPIGWLEISGTNDGVDSIRFINMISDLHCSCPGLNSFMNMSSDKDKLINSGLPDTLVQCLYQLDEYFEGKRTTFDLKLNQNSTDFRNKVWAEVSKIKFGETSNYLNIAKALGDDKAVRAVGNANGKNQLWIVVPCHRVIGSDGSLIGYAGGTWRKKWLLGFEKEQLSLF